MRVPVENIKHMSNNIEQQASRLASVEAATASNTVSIGNLSKNLNDLTESLRIHSDKNEKLIENITNQINKQGEKFEDQINKLGLAIVSASAPKETQWFPLIGTVLTAIGLILTIGALVMIPLWSQAKDNKTDIAELTSEFHTHEKLNLHPVGQALMNELNAKVDRNWTEFEKKHTELDSKIQRETQLMSDLNEKSTASVVKSLVDLDDRLQKEFQLTGKTIEDTGVILSKRVDRLDEFISQQIKDDLEELRQRRIIDSKK